MIIVNEKDAMKASKGEPQKETYSFAHMDRAWDFKPRASDLQLGLDSCRIDDGTDDDVGAAFLSRYTRSVGLEDASRAASNEFCTSTRFAMIFEATLASGFGEHLVAERARIVLMEVGGRIDPD